MLLYIHRVQVCGGCESGCSLNVKRVKWLLFKRVKSVKNHSNHVKITFKMSENNSKVSDKKEQKSEFHFFGELRDGKKQKSCPSVSFPKGEIHSFGVIFILFFFFFSDFSSLRNNF